VKLLWRSFAGGEITPELHGRLDLTKRQTGLGLARNAEILAHGPTSRRPGFAYVLECKDSSQPVKLIGFEFSVDQALIIELGHQYARFHTPAGTVLEANKNITAITQATPGVLTVVGHGWTTNDWVFVHSIAGMTSLNGAFYKVVVVDADSVSLKRLDDTAVSTAGMPAYASGGAAARVYTLATPYAGADVMALRHCQSTDVVTLTHPGYAARELRRLGAANWTLSVITFAAPLSPPTGVAVTPTVAQNQNLTNSDYCVTGVDQDGVTESLASASASGSNNLTLAGNFNTISWAALAGATRYKVYKKRGGIFGYIGQTATLSLVDDNIEADTLLAPPENLITLNASVNDYPSTATYFEQRRWFGGTVNNPQGVWATRTGTESNLTSSVPSQDGDAMIFAIKSAQQNKVRHLVPLSDLAVFTNGAEWRIFSDTAPAVTPTSLTFKPTGYCGASDVQPVGTSGSLLYVQARGSFVRELSYGGEASNYNYRTIDLSAMAPHLFYNKTIVDLAYTAAPDQRLWAPRSDGVLLGMTYMPEHQVYAWHQHDTAGLFKSAASIVAGGEDTLYVVVERVVNGRTVKYVERRAPRVYATAADAFFVDAGLTYSGAPTTTVDNLWHLEGEEVDILADGAVEPRQTVTGGRVVLETPAMKVTIGLPFIFQIKLLPLAVEAADAGGQGTLKNVKEVFLRVRDSISVKAGRAFDALREYPARSVDDDFDSPPEGLTGEIALTIDSDWEPDGAVCVQQDLPLPLMITAVTLDVEGAG
jgi:hypothetical protein